MASTQIRLLFSLACLPLVAGTSLAAPRDIQFRTIDFETNVLELFNFGSGTEALDGWRFCTHDDNQVRRYTASAGFNGISIDAGESLFLHFNNDATGTDAMNFSSLGGSVAGPMGRGAYAIGLYRNSGFGLGTNLADHIQWNIDGIDNTSADDRSDEAEGQVWTDQNLWVATTPTTLRLSLNDLTGAALHGPDDYDVIEPAVLGDYDGNGTVGPEDYAVWRSSFGSTTELAADGNANNVIDAADYTLWRDNLAAPAPAPANAIPEPASLLLLGLLISLACCPARGSAVCG